MGAWQRHVIGPKVENGFAVSNNKSNYTICLALRDGHYRALIPIDNDTKPPVSGSPKLPWSPGRFFVVLVKGLAPRLDLVCPSPRVRLGQAGRLVGSWLVPLVAPGRRGCPSLRVLPALPVLWLWPLVSP